MTPYNTGLMHTLKNGFNKKGRAASCNNTVKCDAFLVAWQRVPGFTDGLRAACRNVSCCVIQILHRTHHRQSIGSCLASYGWPGGTASSFIRSPSRDRQQHRQQTHVQQIQGASFARVPVKTWPGCLSKTSRPCWLPAKPNKAAAVKRSSSTACSSRLLPGTAPREV